MKTRFFVLLAAIFTLLSGSASADGLKALSTDISAWINLQPIRSYIIDNGTYVIVEELDYYGFSVVWNGDERSLYVTCNYEPAKMSDMLPYEINIKTEDIAIGQPIYDIFTTDIKVYSDGEAVSSYNINGKTLINIDDLGKYGYLYWVPRDRKISLDIMDKKLQDEFDRLIDKQELILDESSTYIGQVKDGKPNGLGIITKDFTERTHPNNRYLGGYKGYFKNGERHGFGIESYTYTETRGSFSGLSYDCYGYFNYENDLKSGYCVFTAENNPRSGHYGYEGFYKDDTLNGYGKKWKGLDYGNQFKYKQELIEQGEYIDGVLQDRYLDIEYTNMAYKSVMAPLAIKENDTLWYWGENYPKPFYITDNVKSASMSGGKICVTKKDDVTYEFSFYDFRKSIIPLVVDTEGRKFTNQHCYINSEDELWNVAENKLIMENVRSISNYDSSYAVVTYDNNLYLIEKTGFITAEGGLSYSIFSEPVFLTDNVKKVLLGNSNLIIKTDNTVWSWGYLNYMGLGDREATGEVEYRGNHAYFKEPQYVMSEVKDIANGSTCKIALKNDGTVWVWGSIIGVFGSNYTVTRYPVKLLEDVKDISSRCAVKNDGTLWAWGASSLLSYIDDEEKNDIPVQITECYKPIKVRFGKNYDY